MPPGARVHPPTRSGEWYRWLSVFWSLIAKKSDASGEADDEEEDGEVRFFFSPCLVWFQRVSVWRVCADERWKV